MDVSRIDAYNPNRYDWRNMTAREIIKHEDDGEQVPALYLQWARDFLNSIEADDVTTYEVATSSKKSKREIKQDNVQAEASVREGDAEVGEEPELTPAQREKMSNDEAGVSILKQAKDFRKKSRTLAAQSFVSSFFALPSLKGSSKKELLKLAFAMVALDNRMENIFTNLKNISSLSKVSDSNDNNDAIIQNAYDQGKKLDKTALDGHDSISKTEGNLEDISSQMSVYGELFDSSQDYGGVTATIGHELEASGEDVNMLFFKMSKSVIKAGNNAVKNGKEGAKAEKDAQAANSKNLDSAGKFHNYVEQKSGVQNPQRKNSKDKDKDKDIKSPKAQPETKKMKKDDMDPGNKETIKKENKDLPADRETLVKLEDEDKGNRGHIVKNASKMTTVTDAPPKEEFADDNQKEQTANEFDAAKENDGADERTTTMFIRSESINADNKAIASTGVAQSVAEASQSAYNTLDENIQDLMNEINSKQEELKNEIIAMNNGKSDGIARINSLNEELRTYGISAQSIAGNTEGIINSYAGELDNITDAFIEAISKGNAATSAGAEIIANSADRWLAFKLVNEIIGVNTINVGNRTSADGTKGMSEALKASATVNSNLLSIASLKSEIQSKTGVEGASHRQNTNNGNNENNKDTVNDEIKLNVQEEDISKPNLEKPKEKVREDSKSIRAAQNDGTDVNDKLNTDINEIMNRKVRRGEVQMG